MGPFLKKGPIFYRNKITSGSDVIHMPVGEKELILKPAEGPCRQAPQGAAARPGRAVYHGGKSRKQDQREAGRGGFKRGILYGKSRAGGPVTFINRA